MGHRDWTSLPEDLLALILSNLNLMIDVNQFRAVCKDWQSVPYPKHHIGFGSQWLIEKSLVQSTVKMFHPLVRDPYCMDVPALRGASIRFSNDGWLLMSKGEREMFFFNPFTNSKIKLPYLPENYDFKGVTFISNPTSNDCVIFGIIAFTTVFVEIFTISHGEEDWNVTRINDCPPVFPSPNHPIYHKGKLYCLCKHGELGVFDPNVRDWTVLFPEEKLLSLYENYLLDFNGELMSVFVARMGLWISVFQWDESTSDWVDVHDLGDYMLFLNHTTSFARKSVRDCMKNKIYFPRFHGRYGVFYSLKDGSYQTFGNDFKSEDLNDTAQQLECCWIEPTREDSSGATEVDWYGNSLNSFSDKDDDDTCVEIDDSDWGNPLNDLFEGE